MVTGLPPLTRFDGIESLASFGPMSHFLDQRTEVTYGYGPLKILRYSDYVGAIGSNPALRKDLNVSRWLDGRTGDIHILADPLPRANFPARSWSGEDSKRRASSSRARWIQCDRRWFLMGTGIVSAQDARGRG